MEMKSNIMEIIAEYASTHYESQILQSKEYKELTNNIIELQEDIRKLNLPEEQIQMVKRLIKENGDLYTIYIEKMYKQAMIDCVALLKELKIL
ncbi:MAG: hypothetical protein NC400_08645 [Clostridium sp.]|nr:hypothetical protein [Clostridium sp.]